MWGWEPGGTDCISLSFKTVFLGVKHTYLSQYFFHFHRWISLSWSCASCILASVQYWAESSEGRTQSLNSRSLFQNGRGYWNKFWVYLVRFLDQDIVLIVREKSVRLDWVGVEWSKDGCTLSAQLPSPHGNLSGGSLHFLFSQMFVWSLVHRMRTGRIGKLRVLGATRKKGLFLWCHCSNLNNIEICVSVKGLRAVLTYVEVGLYSTYGRTPHIKGR